MNNPWEEISNAVLQICAAKNPEDQKSAMEKYYARDVYYKNPICEVKASENSREALIGVFQWYRILSPEVGIKVNGQAYDGQPSQQVMYLDITHVFKPLYLPIKARPSRQGIKIARRLRFRKEGNTFVIYSHEDFFHTDDMIGMFIPFAAPIVGLGLKAGTIVSTAMAKTAQMFGFWRPMPAGHANGHAKQQ